MFKTVSLTLCGFALSAGAVAAGVASADPPALPVPAAPAHEVLGFSAQGTGDDPFVIYAHTGPSGQQPGGIIYGQQGSLLAPGGALYRYERVVCVKVEGNLAAVGSQILFSDRPAEVGKYEINYLRDDSATGGRGGVSTGLIGDTRPTCSTVTDPGSTVDAGTIVIH